MFIYITDIPEIGMYGINSILGENDLPFRLATFNAKRLHVVLI